MYASDLRLTVLTSEYNLRACFPYFLGGDAEVKIIHARGHCLDEAIAHQRAAPKALLPRVVTPCDRARRPRRATRCLSPTPEAGPTSFPAGRRATAGSLDGAYQLALGIPDVDVPFLRPVLEDDLVGVPAGQGAHDLLPAAGVDGVAEREALRYVLRAPNAWLVAILGRDPALPASSVAQSAVMRCSVMSGARNGKW